jgi:drug/metabolite transporter (DMT)-like permease
VSRRAWLLFGALSVIWGVPYLLIRISVREVAPSTLIFLRTAPVALVLLPIIAYRNQLPGLVRRWRPLLAYTAAEILLPWLMLFKSEERLTSSLAGLLLAAVPLVGALIARLSGDEDRFDRTQIGGLLLGLAGVALLVGIDVRGATAWPIAAMSVPIVGYAVGPRIFNRYLADLPNLSVVAGSLAIAAICYAPFAFSNLPAHLSTEVTWSVVGLAVGPTLVGFIVFFALIGEIGPVCTTVVTYVNPAVALVLGVVLLGEPFTIGLGLGFPLVIAGSVLASRRRRPTIPRSPAAVEIAGTDPTM